ncbi:MAG: hypothetical protein ACYSSI_12880 [Planctomycetota bacterium]
MFSINKKVLGLFLIFLILVAAGIILWPRPAEKSTQPDNIVSTAKRPRVSARAEQAKPVSMWIIYIASIKKAGLDAGFCISV